MLISTSNGLLANLPAATSRPSSSGGGLFGAIGRAVGGAVSVVGRGAASLLGGGSAPTAILRAVVGGGSSPSEFDTNFDRQLTLLQLQQQIQTETQMFNMLTNIEKAKHDASMSAIRNIR